MSHGLERRDERGWVVARRRSAHPGRFRSVIREERNTWMSASLPLVFFCGMIFESYLALRDEFAAEETLNWLTAAGVGCWVMYRIRKRSLRFADPLLQIGLGILLVGAVAGLTGVLPGFLPELLLKTLGVVLIVFALDRMDRRRVTEHLRNSEEYLESIFESIPEPLCILGESGRILAANRNALESFGSEILGRKCCDVYLGHTDCSRGCTVAEAWDRRKPRFEIVRDAGGARRYEVTTYPIFGRRGFSGKLIQQVRDVSTQVAVEDEASLLHDAVNSVRDPVFVLDLKGQLVHDNRAAEGWIGVDAVDAPPRPATELLPFLRDDDRQRFLQAVRDYEACSLEVVLVRADGDQRSVRLSLSPIRAVDDRLLGSVVMLHDVTERKMLQMQLVQNEKMNALGQLVSGVAHELNNPLTAVYGYSQLLLVESLEQSQLDQVRAIVQHSKRCQGIVEGLLRFSRGRASEKRVCNVNQIVQETLELAGYQLRLHDVRVEVSLDEDIPDSALDGFQFQQVVLNLVTNAQHAMEKTEGERRLHVRSRRADERMAVVEIEDNGCGIPRAVQNKIFDPFFTTKGVGKGTGLGLSISYGILREHGGRMTVSSEVGEGTCFRIELPLEEPSESQAAPPEQQPARSRGPTRSLRVLVVDDEPFILQLLQQILEGEGHRVWVADGGAAALERLAEGGVDVVFSDWRMPEMGGDALYERISNEYPDLCGRVVFTTGDTLDPAVGRAAERHGNHVLNKPFEIEQVRAILGDIDAAMLTGSSC